MTTDQPKLPQAGGSYVIDRKGALKRVEGTAGPLDAEHEDNKPTGTPPAAPAVPAADPASKEA